MSKHALLAALVLACFSLAGLAAQNAGLSAPQGKTVELAYHFPEGKTFVYSTSGNETQNMDVSGQSISVKNVGSSEFTVKPKGMRDGSFVLGITIDAFKINIESPQGNMAPDPSTVTGKSFDMVLSRLGKVVDASGASSIQYDLGMSGKRSVSSLFQAFFPDLPDHPVKAGDTWQSETTINDKSESSDTRISLKNENTLEGFETVDGYECARIKTNAKGALKGTIEQSGITLNLDGTVQSTQTWYFAIKEGVYVKGDEKSAVAGSITAENPAITIPMSGESQGATRLLKK